MHEIEVFILIDADGDYVVAKDEAELATRYTEDIAGDLPLVSRMIAVKLNVALPVAVQLSATVPDATGAATLTVATA